MKKLLLTLLAAAPALAFSQNTFTVKGTAGKINAPSKVFLSYTVDNRTVLDSVIFKNGRFAFTGNIKEVTSARLIVDAKGAGYRNMDKKVKPDMLFFYLAPGTTTVISPDSLAKAKITGTKVNDENAQLKELLKSQNEKMALLDAKFRNASPELRQSKEFMDELKKTADEIKGQEKTVAKKFIREHPNSYISLVLLNSLMGPFPEYNEVAPVYTELSADIKNTATGKAMGMRLEKLKPVALGATAPEFAQADTNGKMVNLSSFRGKYLLINFWAAWCAPTRTENTELVTMFNKYKSKKFNMLSVSLDKPGTKNDWLAAIHKDGLKWPQVSDLQYFKNSVATLYNINALPQNYLLDPNGKIIGKNLRGKDLENKLTEVLGKI